ncbi:hypothetical protein Nepgr_016588 [Nepenthes gracilis]|uniref:Uncharacterized protein n=1 Tax=Nepenthes gracilis TaxID=150966 RepID=A0AAD3SQQ2_NEPGR|nr:hypothetical protein Nepgr_016588 [Nepenthes gracilis]
MPNPPSSSPSSDVIPNYSPDNIPRFPSLDLHSDIHTGHLPSSLLPSPSGNSDSHLPSPVSYPQHVI